MEAKKSNQDEGIPVLLRQNKNKIRKGSENSWYYFGLAGEIGFAIAIPIAGGALIGSSVDTWQHTYPRYTIILLFVGIFLSMVNFIGIIQAILKRQ